MPSAVASLFGGALIGLSASILLLFSGRVAGVSGIVAGLLRPSRGEALWRVLFVAGMLAGGVVMARVHPSAFASTVERSSIALAAAGVLVGFGTRLGNGCTSGHGVCGISRLSLRSIAATATFIVAGVVTVLVVRMLTGAL
jgi:uncharacterized membrane protein YedE/YeeE